MKITVIKRITDNTGLKVEYEASSEEPGDSVPEAIALRVSTLFSGTPRHPVEVYSLLVKEEEGNKAAEIIHGGLYRS